MRKAPKGQEGSEAVNQGAQVQRERSRHSICPANKNNSRPEILEITIFFLKATLLRLCTTWDTSQHGYLEAVGQRQVLGLTLGDLKFFSLVL